MSSRDATDDGADADDAASQFVAELGLCEDPQPARVAHAREPGESAEPPLRLHHPQLTLPWTSCSDDSLPSTADAASGAADRLVRENRTDADGAQCVLHTFRVVCGANVCEAAVLQRGCPRGQPRSPPPAEDLPLSTGDTLYLPATFTMLDQLMRADGLRSVSGMRVCELGAGLGLLSCLLQRVSPPPARLLATDGDARVLPTLASNIAANAPAAGAAAVEHLLWGAALPAALVGAFDSVVAADAVFSATPPNHGSSRLGTDPQTLRHIHALMATSAALLDPAAAPPARLILTAEPRDRLKPAAADPLRQSVPAAEAAGLRCVERRERRLTGQLQPEWLTDVVIFELEPPAAGPASAVSWRDARGLGESARQPPA